MWRIILAFFVPKRWRTTSYLLLLLLGTVFIFVWIAKLRSRYNIIDFGFRYEETDVWLTIDEIGLNECPVCFGHNKSICRGILERNVKLQYKNVTVTSEHWKPRAHSLWNDERISIKHFGNASEFYKIDNELCSLIGKINSPCRVREVAWNSFLNPSSVESAIQDTMECPSLRLMTKLKQIYSTEGVQQVNHNNMLYLTSTLYLNQEPVIFQLFPAENGWPFPKLYGFCGRAVVVEDAGLPLDLFLSEPWIERAKLALAVIKIAKRLTSNQEHWGLYLKEVSMGNFAVSTNRTVKLVDAEQVLVVDLTESNVTAEKKKTNNQCANTEVKCLSFFPIELCQGTIRDQNYYAVCRSVLADIGSRRGLLHSPPEENDFKVMLHDALTECVEAKKIRRTEAIELVMGLLQSKINQANVK